MFQERISPYLGAGDAQSFITRCHFIQGDCSKTTTLEQVEALARKLLGTDDFVRIYYFAIPPQVFQGAIEAVPMAANGNTRVVIEKPLGRDLKSSNVLSSALSDKFGEQNVYRLDHFLGTYSA